MKIELTYDRAPLDGEPYKMSIVFNDVKSVIALGKELEIVFTNGIAISNIPFAINPEFSLLD